MRILILLLCTLTTTSLLAQSPLPPLHAPVTDPTEFGSLRLDPFEAVAPPAGVWTFLAMASYTNQWNGTWHTRRIHEDYGREGKPIGDDELLALEREFPNDEIYRVDLEASRFDLMLSRGFGHGISLQARVPWIVVGSPNWDSIAESFHDAIPAVDHYVRELFPRGETFLYMRTNGRSVVRREELSGSGVGDIAISLGLPLRTTSRTSQRLALTVDLPTGDEETLHGSGGYDAGVRWFWSRTGRRNDFLLAAGYSHNDSSGSFLGFERNDTMHLGADWQRRLTARTAFRGGVRIDSSPLDDITEMNLGDPVIFYKFGIQRQMMAGHWLAFEIGEELAPQTGVDADFSFHLGWSVSGAGGAEQ